ncbi:hypothetical protein M2281_003546 [Mesorhizobium soli]|jgi:hypothetical protein|uniref:XRE family transcriptional regulator n=1 Tax=Pseudaminobacter soli (ex Li et al. 2025) TaxID=1295366 RepID=UPI0024753B89|nr:XRE family transcriptional regulator [Mesorhizobium soli]MDH6232947.1 hypothetical protein [Mesorhizobium soli]
MITGSQCHAGRALVEISRAELASRSRVDELIIEQFEHELELPGPAAIAAIQKALEELGAIFISEDGGGIGVRLKSSKPTVKHGSEKKSVGGLRTGHDVH